MEIKEILFDFDGTIADTVDSVIRYLQENDIGIDIPPVTDQLVSDVRNMTPQEIMKELGLSKFQLIKFIRDYQKYLISDISHLKVVEGMPEVIKKLNEDYTVGILSSNSKSVISEFMKYYELDLFEYMETGAALWSKDTKLKKVLRKRDLNAAEVVYVGDEVKDYESANRVGMHVVSVAWGYNTAEKLQTVNEKAVATTPEEIIEFIEKL